ncbi:GntR family transcriptional regulator [Brachybacterium tyrofermentans]
MADPMIWSAPVALAPSAPKLGEHVAQELRRAIISGALAHDTHLVESRLSEMFGVSRGPVRDALTRLSEEGLVESRRRGTYVRGLSIDDIEELYSLRQLIETDAVLRCIDTPDADFTPAKDALERMREALSNGDASTFAQADLGFHSSFYTVAGHRRIEAIWLQYRPTFAGMLEVTNAQDDNLTPTMEDHDVLLDSVIAGDRSKALDLLGEHLEGSRRRMLDAYERNGAVGVD